MTRSHLFIAAGLAGLMTCFLLMLQPFASETKDVTTVLHSATTSATISESVIRESKAALDRGNEWLLSKQQDSGAWSSDEFPALTGLAVWALASGGHENSEAVSNGVDFILSCVHPDGSIWREPSEKRKGGGLANYNTAMCMVALHRTNRDDLRETVARARTYMVANQHLESDEFRGGFGYDAETERPYADLSNSYIGYEAMRLTQEIEDLRMTSGEQKTDLDWDAALAFVESLHNHDGGFIYKPGHSMAGAETNEQGEVTFRSYGSMTYAGLLSLIYADVDKNDKRVRSAYEWAVSHWTLDENPGKGQEGLYYFYNVLSKALAAYGAPILETANGSRINWREEMLKTLVNRQKIDADSGAGFWQNDAGRWWEADPVLATTYSLIALNIALADVPE